MYISLQSHYAETKIKQAKKPMKSMKQAVSNISTGFFIDCKQTYQNFLA